MSIYQQYYALAVLVVWLTVLSYRNAELWKMVVDLRHKVARLPEVTIKDGTHTLSCNTIGTLHVTGGKIGWCNSEPAPTPTYMHRMSCGHDGLDITPAETVMGPRLWRCPTCGKVEENGMVP